MEKGAPGGVRFHFGGPSSYPGGTGSPPVALVFDTIQGGALAMDFVRIIITILLPPLGIFLQVGIGKHFWINILLTLLGYIPGIVHAVYIIARR